MNGGHSAPWEFFAVGGTELNLGGRTFVDDAFEACIRILVSICAYKTTCPGDVLENLRMTLNKRLETAAAAMVHKIMMRRRPLLLLLVPIRSKGSMGEEVAMLAYWEDRKSSQKREVALRNQTRLVGHSRSSGARKL